jgi:hypothetical protein
MESAALDGSTTNEVSPRSSERRIDREAVTWT